MSWWDRIKQTARKLVGAEPIVKALPPQAEKQAVSYGIHEIGEHLPPMRRDVSPGGRGPRKMIGFDAVTLRMFARQNSTLRSIIDIRKREIAACEWDISPDLDVHEKELSSLRRLVQSVNRLPDRRDILDTFRPVALKRDMVAALITATTVEGITPSELRYRYQLALSDLSRIAEGHANKVRPLFEHPSRMNIGWSHILTATVPDLLILDAMAIEKRRTAHPNKDGWPLEKNPIIELIGVDGATVRPVINQYGILEGLEKPEDDDDKLVLSYEQWIDGRRVEKGGWRYCDLMFLQENPQTDIEFRGHGYSRVESLIMSCVLDAHNDKSDLEEFKRQTYGGALVFKQKGLEREDLDQQRVYFEEELEGTYKIPMFAMPDEKGEVSYVSFSGSPGARDKKADARTMRLIKRMAAAFEIPLTKLEHSQETNYATSKTQQEQADDGLRKLLMFLDDAITRNIVADFGYNDIKYSSKPAHNRDEKAELDIVKQRLELGIWELNDARMDAGEDPIEEGDISWWRWSEAQKAMGQGEGQNATMPPDQGGEEGDNPNASPQDPEGDGEDLDGDGIEQSDQIEDTQVVKALGGIPGHKPETHANPNVEALMSNMAGGLSTLWGDMYPEIEQAVQAGHWISALDDVLRGKDQALEQMVRDFLSQAFGYGAVTAETGEEAIITPATTDQLKQWARENPGHVSTQAMQWLADSAYIEARARQQRIMDTLKQRMIQGIQQGASPKQVASDFVQSIGSTEYSDFQRLARTETAKAFAVGALHQAAEYGIDYVYVPENPGACEHCQRLVVGRVFPREALEGATNYGRKAEDWIPALPVHPNCTDHAIPASAWTISQAQRQGPIPPEGTRVQWVPPAQRRS